MFFPPTIRCTGHSVPLSVPRHLMADFVYFSQKMPLVGLTRRMNLGEVAVARKAVEPAPNWVLLFAKAFAIVATRKPELRRAFMSFLWTRLFESTESVASIAIQRDYQGEPMILFAVILAPDQKSLPELTRILDDYRTIPIEEHLELRRLLQITRLPKFLRRLLWRHALYQSGAIKAQNFGTFGISSVATAGATTVGMASVLTSTLSFGPFDSQGCLDVRLDFDHRVYDGIPAAKALAEVETVLNSEILMELRALATVK
jgi:hypothetical protein